MSQTHDSDRRTELANWTPDDVDNQRRCQNCGAHVSDDFRRTHGDDGTVYRCIECDENHNLAWTAAGLEPRRRFGGSQ